MQKGYLHALQHSEQKIDLMFAPYGPNSTGGTMKPRRFDSSYSHGGSHEKLDPSIVRVGRQTIRTNY
jgi:hypothetical protein